jgi:hypothetical protein
MISVIRAFRSEMLKFRRWSVLVGAGVMVVVSTFIAYLAFHQIASGATGSEMTDPIAAFHPPQGLVAIIGQARSLIVAIALILVSANLAAEWTQGTLRNLLVREPHRLRWLAGKMLAVVLFVLLSMLLTLVISSTVILLLARRASRPRPGPRRKGCAFSWSSSARGALSHRLQRPGHAHCRADPFSCCRRGDRPGLHPGLGGDHWRRRAAGGPLVSWPGVQHHCGSDGADDRSPPYSGLSGGPAGKRPMNDWFCRDQRSRLSAAGHHRVTERQEVSCL